MINLNLKEEKKTVIYTEKINNENNYKEWKNYQKAFNKRGVYDGFFMTPGRLVDYLPSLTDRALNLYLFYGIRANSKSGKTWVSADTCAKELKVTPRSINTWNEKLITLGLIARVDENSSSKSTYLLPLDSFSYTEKNVSPQKYNSTSVVEISGALIDVLHLFQWRKADPDSETFEVPYNTICLVYRRSHQLKNSNENKNIYKVISFENVEDIGVEINKVATEFEADIYKFDSGFKLNKDIRIETKGMAITSKINLKSSEELLNIAIQITEGDKGIISNLPEVELV